MLSQNFVHRLICSLPGSFPDETCLDNVVLESVHSALEDIKSERPSSDSYRYIIAWRNYLSDGDEETQLQTLNYHSVAVSCGIYGYIRQYADMFSRHIEDIKRRSPFSFAIGCLLALSRMPALIIMWAVYHFGSYAIGIGCENAMKNIEKLGGVGTDRLSTSIQRVGPLVKRQIEQYAAVLGYAG